MPFIEIDKKKCAGDGKCIRECALDILVKGPDGFPTFRPEAVSRCIECGHCQAVCPRDALTLRGVEPGELPLSMKWPAEQAIVEGLIRSRRSVRRFKPDPVAPEVLDDLLALTRWAPTGGNSQLVKWLLVEKPETMKAISGLVADWARGTRELGFLAAAWDAGHDVILRGAPNLAIAYAGDGYGSTAADCVIAAATLELAATSRGLGACWAGFFMIACANGYPPLLDLLGLKKEDGKVHAALMLGHPQYVFHRVPTRHPVDIRHVDRGAAD